MILLLAHSFLYLIYSNSSSSLECIGEKSSEKLRAHLHRSLLIAVVVFLLVSFPLQLNAEAILVLFGQDSTVAHITGICIIIFLPAAFAYYVFEVLSRYLYAQELFMPVIAGAVGIIIIAIVELVLLIFVLPVNIYGEMSSILQYKLYTVY